MLIRAVEGNDSLKRLLLATNNVTTRGLMVIFNSLLNGDLTLEELDLHKNNINFGELTNENWHVLARALCDKSSIDSTFCSNQTLHGIRLELSAGVLLNEVVCDIESSLEINHRTKYKEEAAREKILKHHFAGEESASIKVFARMPENVLPNALEWIGRSRGTLTYSILFNVVQSIPTLFNITNEPTIQGAKKNKFSSSM